MQYGLDTAAAAYYSSNHGSNAPYAQAESNRLSQQSPGDVQYNEEYADGDWGGGLPHVDDLEVAAAAAEEELEAQKQRLRAAQSMKKSIDDSDSSEVAHASKLHASLISSDHNRTADSRTSNAQEMWARQCRRAVTTTVTQIQMLSVSMPSCDRNIVKWSHQVLCL